MLKFTSSVVFVSNINVSKDFYIQLLKQEIELDFGTNISFKSGISLWQVNQAHVIAQELNTSSNNNRFELYFESDQIEKDFEELKSRGVKFLHEINEEPWGQQTIRFFDPDGHLVEIGEPMEVFVRNMKKKGLTAKQIAAKSGISIETINSILK
ncbi:MAG TPA: VOC family protein [Bacteroidales bacterium]|nr:VOC family protein [Bacteroidales bacterium]